MAKAENITRLRPVRPCPICETSSAQKYHPFCSRRCADVDLNRWLNGSYVIPARDDEKEEGDEVWTGDPAEQTE